MISFVLGLPNELTKQSSKPREESVTLSFPKPLAERIQKRLPKTEFALVDEYVAYVMEQILNEIESEPVAAKEATENVFSKEDMETVEQRLRDLGYL